MADTSKIEWTDATWNIITGCTLVDEGCRHCYAAHLITSWPAIGNHPSRKGLARENAAGESKFTGEVRFNEDWLDQPLRWKKPRKIFVCAHGDLFHESVPDEWIDRVFAVMALAPQHTFQVLTKRPERAATYLAGMGDSGPIDIFVRGGGRLLKAAEYASRNSRRLEFQPVQRWPLRNVWLGTSISDQASADQRIPHLLAAPAAVRFISAEPLLGPVDLRGMTAAIGINVMWPIDWVIVGGESGPHARPMHPDWARSLRDQCAAAGVPFLFKQWGEWGAGSYNMLTGQAVFRAFPNFQTWVNKASTWVNGGTCMDTKGRICKVGADMMRARDEDTFPVTILHRIGKSRAGRLLDGVEHNGFPQIGGAV